MVNLFVCSYVGMYVCSNMSICVPTLFMDCMKVLPLVSCHLALKGNYDWFCVPIRFAINFKTFLLQFHFLTYLPHTRTVTYIHTNLMGLEIYMKTSVVT